MKDNSKLFEPVTKKTKIKEKIFDQHTNIIQSSLMSLKNDRVFITASLTLIFLILGSIFFPLISQHTYNGNDLNNINSPPSFNSLFGTDELGRDIFVRIWFGGRISLLIGIISAFVNLIIGSLVGGISGYCYGRADEAIMRILDLIDSVPNMLFAMFLMSLMNGNIFSVIFVISITSWIDTARIVRGQVLLIKNMEFVHAAKLIGASDARILLYHIFPNILGPMIISVTSSIPYAIFSEAYLSFLGLGVELPTASWGSMASDGLLALRYYPWRILLPSSFISVTILCFNCIGNGLQNAIEKRGNI